MKLFFLNSPIFYFVLVILVLVIEWAYEAYEKLQDIPIHLFHLVIVLLLIVYTFYFSKLRKSKKASDAILLMKNKELEEKNLFLQTVIQSLNHPFAVIDVENYQVKIANTLNLSELQEKPICCHTLFHHSDKPCSVEGYLCPVEIIKKNKKSIRIEHQHYDKDNNLKYYEIHGHPIFDSNGELIQIIEYSIDITDRKMMEKQLVESETRVRSIIDNSPLPICITNRNGIFEYVNDAYCQFYGYQREELIGNSFLLVVPKNYQEKAQELHDDFIQKQKEIGHEWEVITRSGEIKNIIVNAILIYDKEQKPQKVTFIVDITDRKKMQEKLEETLQKLTESNQLLENFASIAAHDMKEPIRMIINYLSLLEKRYQQQLDQDAKDFIFFASDGAKRMRSLIDDLLNYSKISVDNHPFQVFDMNSVLKDTLKNLEILIRENQALIDYPENLPTLFGNPIQIGQLLQNLINNAIKFRKTLEAPKITIRFEDKNTHWLFSIQDNGIGIPSDQKERIFGIFQRLNARKDYPGNGIGLALCKKIVENHKGKIWVESSMGQGSTFYFTILKQKNN